MAYTRILADNVARQASSVVCTTQNSAYPATNLLLQQKSKVWRSANNLFNSITLTWDEGVWVDTVALAFTNFTPSVQVSVYFYTEVADTSTVDTIPYQHVLADSFENLEFGAEPLGQSLNGAGIPSTCSVYSSQPHFVKKLIIRIRDLSYYNSFFEVGCVAVGKYFEFTNGCEYGATVSFVDNTSNQRAESGDLRSVRGCSYKKISLSLADMPSEDKSRLWNALSSVGKHTPLFISVNPEAEYPTDELLYQLYGKLSSDYSIQFKYLNMFDTTLEIEEV